MGRTIRWAMLALMLLVYPAAAYEPCLTYVLDGDDDATACQYETDGAVMEGEWFYLDVWGWEPEGSTYEGDWCNAQFVYWSYASGDDRFYLKSGWHADECWQNSWYQTPYPDVQIYTMWHRTDESCGTLGANPARYLGYDWGYVDLHDMHPYCGTVDSYVRANFLSSAPNGEATISGGCGGITVGEEVSAQELLDFEDDWYQWYATNLDLTVVRNFDHDTEPNDTDNCPAAYNPGQEDANSYQDDDSSLPGVQHYGQLCDPDLNNDGGVGVADATKLSGTWGCTGTWSEDPEMAVQGCYRPAYDLNMDGGIGSQDYMILTAWYGKAPLSPFTLCWPEE